MILPSNQIKYKDLQIGNMKAKVISLVIGATGLVTKATIEAMKEVPGFTSC